MSLVGSTRTKTLTFFWFFVDELVPPKGGSDSSNSIGGGRSASGGIGSGLDANRDLDPFFMSPNIIGSLDAGGTVGDAAMATLGTHALKEKKYICITSTKRVHADHPN